MRFLSGRAISLSHSFTDDEETLVIPSVAVSVTKQGESFVVFTGAATNSNGTWTVNIPSQPAGIYDATFTSSVAVDKVEFEVVGAFLFSVKEARDADEDLRAARYTATKIRHYREVVEREFEIITRRSFTPRTITVRVMAEGGTSLFLGIHDVTAARDLSVDGVVYDDPDWFVTPAGFLQTPYDIDENTLVQITLDYGFRHAPAELKRAGILRLRSLLANENSGIPDRATSFIAAEGGTFTLATPGLRGAETGLPEVDAILARYTYRIMTDVIGAY